MKPDTMPAIKPISTSRKTVAALRSMNWMDSMIASLFIFVVSRA